MVPHAKMQPRSGRIIACIPRGVRRDRSGLEGLARAAWRFLWQKMALCFGERPILQADILFEMDPFATQQAELLLVGASFPAGWTEGLAARAVDVAQALLALDGGRPLVLLAAAAALDGPLGAALTDPLLRPIGLALVMNADASPLDHAAALLSLPNLQFLSADAPAHEARAMLAALVGRQSGAQRVADGEADFTGYRLEALRQDAERVARALAELAAGQPEATEPARPVDAARVRAHIRARRARDQFFGPELFADPAWDMLLDLSAARMEGRRVSVSSLCIAAAVPTTTALRWIKTLIDRGLLAREADPEDGRRAFISLSAPAVDAMALCLDHVLNAPGQ